MRHAIRQGHIVRILITSNRDRIVICPHLLTDECSVDEMGSAHVGLKSDVYVQNLSFTRRIGKRWDPSDSHSLQVWKDQLI